MKKRFLYSILVGMPIALVTNVEAVKGGCFSCISFAQQRTGIAQTKNFIIDLHNDQTLPGRLVVATKKHIPSLAKWPKNYWNEFGRIVFHIEKAMQNSFAPKLINWACLMNLNPHDPHTHFHALPRYEHPITIQNEKGESVIFRDENFGKPYVFDAKNYKTISAQFAQGIIKKIQNQLDPTEFSFIKNVIFDLGGVLLQGNKETVAQETGVSLSLVKEIAQTKAWHDWHKGFITAQNLYELLEEKYNPTMVQRIIQAFLSPNRKFDTETMALAQQLKTSGYRLFLLSNFSHEAHQKFIEPNQQFKKMFDGMLFSFEANTIKPCDAIYQKLMDTYGLNAKESAFIDDQAKNIVAADQLGMKGILYQKDNFKKMVYEHPFFLNKD